MSLTSERAKQTKYISAFTATLRAVKVKTAAVSILLATSRFGSSLANVSGVESVDKFWVLPVRASHGSKICLSFTY